MTGGSPPSRAASGRAMLLVALSACGFGTISVLITIALGTGAPLVTLLSGRYLVGATVLGVIAAAQGQLRFDRRSLRLIAFAGTGQVLVSVVSLAALKYISAGTLAFLFYTYPAWVAIIAKFRHSEPLTPLRMFALALALAGIFVMVGAPGTESLHSAGVTLALTAALLYAIYVPTMAVLQKDVPPVATATYMSGGAAVILVVAGAFMGDLTLSLHRTAWTVILVLGIVSTALAFLAWLRGLAVIGPVRTAIVSTVEPFFTAVLGAWLLGQPLTRTTLIGGAFIAFAVVLLQLLPPTDTGRGT